MAGDEGELRARWNYYAHRVLGVHVPMYEGTRHSTATDAIRRGVSLDQIQAALRDADAASTCVYAHRRNQQVVAGRTGLEFTRHPGNHRNVLRLIAGPRAQPVLEEGHLRRDVS
jgi:hypothetical protein